jgi:DNA-binding winged helix-turn-helix (wHTH) protein
VVVRILFGDFAFDRGSRQLFRGNVEVHLGPKAFTLIELLLSRRPRAVSKAQVRDAVWPRTFVAESNLTSLLNELRSALGDDAKHPRFIRTVRGFGYAFCAEAQEAEASASPETLHWLFWGRQELPLRNGENILGRSPRATQFLDGASVSRRHALIRVSGAEALLEDSGSKNGTFLHGKKLTGPVPLKDGDEIRLGSIRITYRRFEAADSTVTARQ